jgi:hypothetical protein
MFEVRVIIECFFDGDNVNDVMFLEVVKCVTLKIENFLRP